MQRLVLATGILALSSLSSLAQIVTINPTPPPCAGAHCIGQLRGARIEHRGAASLQKASCPAGTVYNVRKGTCRVLN